MFSIGLILEIETDKTQYQRFGLLTSPSQFWICVWNSFHVETLRVSFLPYIFLYINQSKGASTLEVFSHRN